MKRIIALSIMGILALAPAAASAQEGMEKFFDEKAPPNAGPMPDYSKLYYWAASPFKHDCADSIPEVLQHERRDSTADVFFIHPTTFIGAEGDEFDVTDFTNLNLGKAVASMRRAAWNADLDDTALNRQTDFKPILYQATAFNGSCRVFAPRYRQANLKAFFVRHTDKARVAFDIAYEDIRSAFQYYLDHYNHGRPIIIASHSQGSLHAIRLLQDFFDGTPLQKQLVCAYVVGYQIPGDAFAHIPTGTKPEQTGCVVGWRTYQTGEIPPEVKSENGNAICVNPLTWSDTSGWAPKSLDLGSMTGFDSLRIADAGMLTAEIEPSLKILWVTLPPDSSPKVRRMRNLHIYDYNLFWMNIRANVRARIAAYQQAHSGSAETQMQHAGPPH